MICEYSVLDDWMIWGVGGERQYSGGFRAATPNVMVTDNNKCRKKCPLVLTNHPEGVGEKGGTRGGGGEVRGGGRKGEVRRNSVERGGREGLGKGGGIPTL